MPKANADAPTRADDLRDDLLEVARANILHDLHLDRNEVGWWRVESAWTRPRADVYRLSIRTPARKLYSYYKVAGRLDRSTGVRRPPADEDFRTAIARSIEAEEDLAVAVRGLDCRIPRLLAADVEQATTISTAVTGRALGLATPRLVQPFRTRSAMFRLGRALRSIETVGRRWADDRPIGAMIDSFDRRLEAIPSLSQEDLSALKSRVRRSYAGAGESARWIASHGDVSPTNVLIDGKGLGLIDFSWSLAPPGHGVFQLSTRLAFQRPQYRRWTLGVERQLVNGYLHESPDPSRDSYALDLCRLNGWLRMIEYRRPERPPRQWAEQMVRLMATNRLPISARFLVNSSTSRHHDEG